MRQYSIFPTHSPFTLKFYHQYHMKKRLGISFNYLCKEKDGCNILTKNLCAHNFWGQNNSCWYWYSKAQTERSKCDTLFTRRILVYKYETVLS